MTRLILLAALTVAAACSSTSSSESSDGEVVGTATRPLVLTSPADTPPVDRTQASVDLDRIVFDTFGRGPTFTLDAGRDDAIDSLFDAIAPIDAPRYESADSASWLDDDDLVVGYEDPEGGAWAYPARILNRHEIINDELGALPVLVSYCPLCGSGVVYDRRLGDRELSFSNTSALFENDMVMVDRETGSYWWQVAGEAIVGTLTGDRLTPVHSVTTTWGHWRSTQPDTYVLARPPGRDYSGNSFARYGELLDSGRTPFPVSDGVLTDDRLTPSARVVVVSIGDEHRAWATSPAREVTDSVGGVDVTVTTDGTGAVVMGPDGTPLPARAAFWFSIVSAYPEVTLGP